MLPCRSNCACAVLQALIAADVISRYVVPPPSDVLGALGLREEFFPNGVIWSARITGVDSLMADAVRFRFIPAPLAKEKIAQLIEIR
jgi:hypothetical protein